MRIGIFYDLMKSMSFYWQSVCAIHMECWNTGIMEYWGQEAENTHFLIVFLPLNPLFQYSTIPIGAKPLNPLFVFNEKGLFSVREIVDGWINQNNEIIWKVFLLGGNSIWRLSRRKLEALSANS